MTVTITRAPAKGAITVSGAGAFVFSFTPTANANGADGFEYRVSDPRGGRDTATVVISIEPVSDPPTVEAATFELDEDGSRSARIIANDVDGDGLTLSIVTPPAQGVAELTNAATGDFTYTPHGNFNGDETFVARASDGVFDSAGATITMRVQTLNDAPVASANYITVPATEDSLIDVLANDVGVDGDPLILELLSQPPGASVSVVADRIHVSPAAGSGGPTEFSYRVRDAAGVISSATATFFAGTLAMSPNGNLITYNDQWAKVTPPQQFASIDVGVERPTFTRDGQIIFYTQIQPGGGRRIKRKAVGSGSFETYVTAQYATAQGLGMDFRLTPDEAKVVSTGPFLHAGVPSGGPMQSAFVSTVDGRFNDQRLHPAYTMTDEYADQPEITADSRYAYYVARLSGTDGIYATDLATPGVPIRLDVNPESAFATGPTTTADSRTLFYSLRQVGCSIRASISQEPGHHSFRPAARQLS